MKNFVPTLSSLLDKENLGLYQMILKMLELEPIMNILKSYKKLIELWMRTLFMWLVITILHPGAAIDIVVTN